MSNFNVYDLSFVEIKTSDSMPFDSFYGNKSSSMENSNDMKTKEQMPNEINPKKSTCKIQILIYNSKASLIFLRILAHTKLYNIFFFHKL